MYISQYQQTNELYPVYFEKLPTSILDQIWRRNT